MQPGDASDVSGHRCRRMSARMNRSRQRTCRRRFSVSPSVACTSRAASTSTRWSRLASSVHGRPVDLSQYRLALGTGDGSRAPQSSHCGPLGMPQPSTSFQPGNGRFRPNGRTGVFAENELVLWNSHRRLFGHRTPVAAVDKGSASQLAGQHSSSIRPRRPLLGGVARLCLDSVDQAQERSRGLVPAFAQPPRLGRALCWRLRRVVGERERVSAHLAPIRMDQSTHPRNRTRNLTTELCAGVDALKTADGSQAL